MNRSDIAEALAAQPETARLLDDALGELDLPTYIKIDPTAKQEWFLLQDALEVFFGGSAGGGKTAGILAAALQYVDHPAYRALVLRPTLSEFFIPGGLHEVLIDWMAGTDARFVGGPVPQWRFPSGANVSYGYLANISDSDRYKGGELSFIGFEEAVGFTLRQYLGMLRLLRGEGERVGIPPRIRAVSNPSTSPRTMGNQAWIKQRFIDPATRPDDVIFIASSLLDNPHVDYDAYVARLAHMLPADRARLINGDWDILEEGALFHREWFGIVPEGELRPPVRAVRYWDLAATEESPQNPDPDYTVGLRLEQDAVGQFTVTHIIRGRWPAHEVEEIVKSTAKADNRRVQVHIEQEPGASGKQLIDHYRRKVLPGFIVQGHRPTGDKLVRARPVAAAAGNGLVSVVEGCPHLLAFLDEVGGFGAGVAHDDCVDALSGAHTAITRVGALNVPTTTVPRARLPINSAHGTGGQRR